MVNQDLDGFESKLQLLNEKASPVLLNHIRFNECIDEFLINVHEYFEDDVLNYVDLSISEDQKSVTFMTGNEKSGILSASRFEKKNQSIMMASISVDEEERLTFSLSNGTLVNVKDIELYNASYYAEKLSLAKVYKSDLMLFTFYDFRCFMKSGLEIKNDHYNDTIFLSSSSYPDIIVETLSTYKPKFSLDSFPMVTKFNSDTYKFTSISRELSNFGVLHVVNANNGKVSENGIVKAYTDEPENLNYLPQELKAIQNFSDIDNYKRNALNEYLGAVERCYKIACEQENAYKMNLYNSLVQQSKQV